MDLAITSSYGTLWIVSSKDTEPPLDVYTALDFTVPGLVSEQSIANGGAPVEVPDFRNMD